MTITELFKYGKQKWMENCLYSGEILLNSAQAFGETSLSIGAHDPEELIINQTIDPKTNNVKIIAEKNNQEITPIGSIKESVISKTDYYIYCLSLVGHSNKIYEAFKADTMIHIKEPQIFIERMYKALDQKFPNYSNLGKPITYIDESSWVSAEVDVFFNKNGTYKYQKEFRFVCLPDDAKQNLKPLLLSVGNIEDIADIHFKNYGS